MYKDIKEIIIFNFLYIYVGIKVIYIYFIRQFFEMFYYIYDFLYIWNKYNIYKELMYLKRYDYL